MQAHAATGYPKLTVRNDTNETLSVGSDEVNLKGRGWSEIIGSDRKIIKPGKSKKYELPLVTGGYKNDKVRVSVFVAEQDGTYDVKDKWKSKKQKCNKRYHIRITK